MEELRSGGVEEEWKWKEQTFYTTQVVNASKKSLSRVLKLLCRLPPPATPSSTYTAIRAQSESLSLAAPRPHRLPQSDRATTSLRPWQRQAHRSSDTPSASCRQPHCGLPQSTSASWQPLDSNLMSRIAVLKRPTPMCLLLGCLKIWHRFANCNHEFRIDL